MTNQTQTGHGYSSRYTILYTLFHTRTTFFIKFDESIIIGLMVKIYSRPGCAYCPMVSKYLDMLGVEYSVVQAEGEEYNQLANKYGFSVPLTVNGDKAFMGWNPAKIKELVV